MPTKMTIVAAGLLAGADALSQPLMRVSRVSRVSMQASGAADIPDMSDVGLDMLTDAMDAAEAEFGSPEPPKFNIEELAGVTAPLGFFDPAGFCEEASEGKIRFYREVLGAHARACGPRVSSPSISHHLPSSPFISLCACRCSCSRLRPSHLHHPLPTSMY